MSWLLRLLNCRRGNHRPEMIGYDIGMLIECKDCHEILHYKFYATDDEEQVDEVA